MVKQWDIHTMGYCAAIKQNTADIMLFLPFTSRKKFLENAILVAFKFKDVTYFFSYKYTKIFAKGLYINF